ncbi:AfsR/SARP family transcriptional regulator [Allorhizocola rhizosphaerae]|uniref:AfsR/SARP family transcriptional regulator n=1 Tax=Allorhizocola rhizosphaerae TaxID=1872709 RepID=UPI000E3C57AD|nr:AfsR/SARP family transcriptional regulator [Allorhizocola rhizosphaerae]
MPATEVAPKALSIRVLGPVELLTDGRLIQLNSQERGVLATLAAQSGRLIAADGLIDALWTQSPPKSVRNRIHALISTLRRHMGAYAIASRSGGYLLRLNEGDHLDAIAFERLVADARNHLAAADNTAAVGLYRHALDLWRGKAYGDVALSHLVPEATRLDELHRNARAEYFDARLRLGAHAEVIGELTALVAQEPLEEQLRGQLMLALYRCGRQVEALQIFESGARVLAEELGLDPCQRLRTLRHAILCEDPSLAAPRQRAVTGRVPKQLPAGIADFVGRAQELTAIRTRLGQADSAHAASIVSIVGMPGVGKTAIAIRAAHEAQASYPDGSLFVRLRDRGPLDALGQFLRALGQDPARLPIDLDERAAMFRSMLCHRRVLIVLDDVLSEHQVRPLLPSAGSAVIITSRNELAGLESARPVRVPPMSLLDSMTMLSQLTGGERVAACPDAAARVAELCGRLPLALRAVGARLARRPELAMSTVAGQLAPEHDRLDLLTAGDLDVRSTMWSCLDGLDPDLAHLLRELADHHTIVASSCRRAQLERLAAAGLVDTADGKVYRAHVLIRLAARERLPTEEQRFRRIFKDVGGTLWQRA